MLESLIASEDLSFGSVPNGYDAAPAGPRGGMGLSQVSGRWLAWQSNGAPSLWPRICAAMAKPELLSDDRFATPEARRDSWPELHAIVTTWLRAFDDVIDAMAALQAARIPCALVRTVEEVVECPQLAARGTFQTVSHPGVDTLQVTASPYWIDGAPVGPSGPAPYRIGEHTQEVLSQRLGYSREHIEALERAGALQAVESTD